MPSSLSSPDQEYIVCSGTFCFSLFFGYSTTPVHVRKIGSTRSIAPACFAPYPNFTVRARAGRPKQCFLKSDISVILSRYNSLSVIFDTMFITEQVFLSFFVGVRWSQAISCLSALICPTHSNISRFVFPRITVADTADQIALLVSAGILRFFYSAHIQIHEISI